MRRHVLAGELASGDRIVWCGRENVIVRIEDGEPEGASGWVRRSLWLEGFDGGPQLAAFTDWVVEAGA